MVSVGGKALSLISFPSSPCVPEGFWFGVSETFLAPVGLGSPKWQFPAVQASVSVLVIIQTSCFSNLLVLSLIAD